MQIPTDFKYFDCTRLMLSKAFLSIKFCVFETNKQLYKSCELS